MPGLAEYEELGWGKVMEWEEGSVPKAPFDKVVFMVVDALRSDFVYGEESGMEFVQRYAQFQITRWVLHISIGPC